MSSDLHLLLQTYRDTSKTQREKGTYFEHLCKAFLENDPRYKSQFSKVWMFSDWAKEQNIEGKDLGVDLVAQNNDNDLFCAIQCKLYAKDATIQKTDINSFYTELGKKWFSRGIIIDTTAKEWGTNAESTLSQQSKPVNRIGLDILEESNIDWSKYQPEKPVEVNAKKVLRPHQQNALNAVKQGLETADRGKLIMACGTGKTFTSLKIAETLAGKGKRVLFMVPSISLMSQTITEWMIETGTPIQAFSVCSDSSIGKRKSKNDDIAELTTHDLAFPATTDAGKLAKNAKIIPDSHLQIIFCTYQSIQVVSDAQIKGGLPEFDLIICDEAHRTTGVILKDKNESNFTKIHDNDNVKAKKRIYMTATPRLYAESAKKKADEGRAVLCSMDETEIYGEEFFGFAN